MTTKTKSIRRTNGERRVLSDQPSREVLDVTVVILDAGHPSTAIGPIEVFQSAGVLWNWLNGDAPQPRFRIRIASIDGAQVTSLCGLGITPHCSIDDVVHTDIIILSTAGWDVQNRIVENTMLLPWLRKWHSQGAYVAGVCTSVAFLAESGLLDGRQATTHWGVAEELRERYPQVLWRPDQFVTEDNRVLCSGGVYASIDLSLYLVEKFCGHEIALQSAKSLLLSMPRALQSGYSVVPLSRPHTDDKIKQAEEYFQLNYTRGVSIDTAADHIGMSPRNFIRRFKTATGRLPGAYIQTLRMSAAKELLERSDLAVQNVCSKIGYEDVAFFRNLFKRHTGMTPAEYRNRFSEMSFVRADLASETQSLTA
jgi:transcriptional regulator GlxA family with amidase domain